MKNKINKLDLLSFIGKKWAVPVLFAITRVPKTYSEIYCELNSKINHTLFTERLKTLSKWDIIKKTNLNKGIFYQITPKGQRLKKKVRELLFFNITEDI